MMEKLHTPEPWIEAGPSFGAEKMAEVTEIVTVYGEDDDEESDTICEFPGYIDKETRAANARRIVACVNFCKGLSTENIENDTLESSLKEALERVKTQRDNATAQRDELLAALTHAATDYIDQNGSVPSWWTEKIRQMVKETTKS